MTDIPLTRLPAGIIVPDDNYKMKGLIIARLFASLSDEQQAQFFDTLADIDATEWSSRGVFQWRSMEKHLTPRAKRLIGDMYNHTDGASS